MSYVGELIMSLRESAPDLPVQVYPPPPAPSGFFSVLDPAGALAPNATYYFVYTLVFPWGETLPSPEASFALPAGYNSIDMNVGGQQLGMLGYRVYYSTASGQQTVSQFINITLPNGYPFGPNTIPIRGYPLHAGQPPTRNTAYVPDADGRMLSAFRVYSWLNDGLGIAGQITGGLPNFTGIRSNISQPWYGVPGNWKKIDGAWYNGYPIFFGRRTDVFRKNSVTGISAALCVDMYTDRMIVELWPQPSTDGFYTQLSAPLGITDTVASLDPSFGSNFQTSFGFVQIGDPIENQPYEIASVQSSSNFSLQGMVRGWGGTRASAWQSGASVYELNICLSGLIIPPPYSPGDCFQSLHLPPGWASGLHKYMLSRFREAERRRQEAKSLLDEFTATMQNLRTTRQYAGPIQIQANTGRGSEVYPGLGGPFGGVIVP